MWYYNHYNQIHHIKLLLLLCMKMEMVDNWLEMAELVIIVFILLILFLNLRHIPWALQHCYGFIKLIKSLMWFLPCRVTICISKHWKTITSLIRMLFAFFFLVGLLPPQNMYITDEWYTRFRVSWDPSPSPVLGYKIVYKPVGKKTCSFWVCHFQNSK